MPRPNLWCRPLVMPSKRYGSLKAVTILQEMAEIAFEAGAGGKGSVIDYKTVQYIYQREKLPS